MTSSTGSASCSTRASSGSTRTPASRGSRCSRPSASTRPRCSPDGARPRPSRDRHAAAFLELAQRAAPELAGPTSGPGSSGSSASTTTCGPALDWAIAEPDPGDREPDLSFALWRFWQQRGYLNEARGRFEAWRRRAGRSNPSARRGSLRRTAAIAYWQSDQATADALVRRGTATSGARSATSARSPTRSTTAPTPT